MENNFESGGNLTYAHHGVGEVEASQFSLCLSITPRQLYASSRDFQFELRESIRGVSQVGDAKDNLLLSLWLVLSVSIMVRFEEQITCNLV